MSLCPKHHKLHHKGLLGIAGNADQPGGVVYTDHNGRPLDEHGKPRVPTGPPPEPEIGYRHPTGERLQWRWVHWQHPANLDPRFRPRS